LPAPAELLRLGDVALDEGHPVLPELGPELHQGGLAGSYTALHCIHLAALLPHVREADPGGGCGSPQPHLAPAARSLTANALPSPWAEPVTRHTEPATCTRGREHGLVADLHAERLD
jgi:hypothetical protein